MSISKRILIIDDDLTALDIVQMLFEDAGFEVDRCTSGTSALSYIDAQASDVILVDLMMPHMNGQELVALIRERGWTGPIVAFTAVDDPIIHAEAVAAGCTIVLTKPCRASELVDRVKRLL